MKKITLMMFSFIVCIGAYSQGTMNEPAKTGKRFFAGVSYMYLSAHQKLSALTLHSEWYGEDFGTHELTEDEIDEVNAVIDRNSRVHCMSLEAGMHFIQNEASGWTVDGKILLGLAGNQNEIQNNSTDTLEFSYKSGLTRPAFGLGLDIAYHLNDQWALSLKPFAMSTMGANTEIVDNLSPNPVNVTETSDDKYWMFYEHLSLTVDFAAGNFTFSAGPGFYWINLKHEYTITRTNDLNGDLLIDEITTKTFGESFIDANVAVEWKITEMLDFYAAAGIGADLMLNTGLHYNF